MRRRRRSDLGSRVMPRILHVLGTPRAEGTPRLVLDWLTVKGPEQAVLFLSPRPDDLLEDFQRTGVKVAVADTLGPGPLKALRMFRAARRQARAFCPDVVISWPVGFSPWVFMGVRAAGNRALLLSHCGNPPKANSLFHLLMTWLCAWTTAALGGRMIACSRYIQRLFLRIPLVPSSVVACVYNCVRSQEVGRRAAAARGRTESRRFRAIMVATLEGHKDHATLIRAAQILQDRGTGIEILLVGEGTLRPSLERLADELGVGNTVTFLGARSDVPELLGRSDVFVLSTTPEEGRPGVILEALAAGLPIIASDVEPLREVLEDGRWGILVPAGDPQALASELFAATQAGPCDRSRIREAQAHALGFSPERMMAEYLGQGLAPGAERQRAVERGSAAFSK
jgi:glycosyltransferase involved in cell wall biosynthesis